MNTKPIPAVIMMIAGFITCLIAVFNRMDLTQFLKTLLGVLVGFYIFGCIIKLILDKNFAAMEEKENIENSEINDENEIAEAEDESETQNEDMDGTPSMKENDT